MDTPNITRPSTRTVGISTLILGLVGLVAGTWYYQTQTRTQSQRLRRSADRQMKRVRGRIEGTDLSPTATTGLAVGILGAVAALVLGGSEAYRRSHR